MADKYTRWMDLFEQEEPLRPEGLHYEDGWILTSRVDFDSDLPLTDEQAENMIAGKVIRWFNTKHEGLTIGDGSWDDKYQGEWPSGSSVRVFSPCIDEIRSGGTLLDALYELVLVVLERIEADLLRGH